MRQVQLSPLLLTAAMGWAGLACAQSQGTQAPAPQAAKLPATAPASLPAVAVRAGEAGSSPSRANQLIENITVEDGGARIEEHRFGGETRSITVQPKGGLPAYDVQPSTGARSWKILDF